MTFQCTILYLELKEKIKNIFIYLYIKMYKIGEKLGQGTYGEVYKGTNPYGKKVAIKQMELNEDTLLAEIDILFRFKHKHLLSGEDLYFKNDKINLVLPLADGTIEDYLDTKRSYEDKIRLCYEITDAILFLYHNGVYHCDLKTDNVLMKDGNVLIGDYSISVYKKSRRNNKENLICQSLHYAPPEIFLLRRFNLDDKIPRNTQYGPVHVWALGMMFYYVFKGDHFFSIDIDEEYVKFVRDGTVDDNLVGIPDSMKSLIKSMIEIQAENRIKIDDEQQ